MSALQLKTRERAIYLLTGPQSGAVLAAAGLPLPEAQLSAEERPGALVARTGRDEYLAVLAPELPELRHEWCFRRHDALFELAGSGWVELMAHLCQYDFRRLAPGGWLMASVAGVNAWLYHEIESGSLLIGVDPGFRHYFNATISAVLDDLSATRKLTGEAS